MPDAITSKEYRDLPLDWDHNFESLAFVDATPDEGYPVRILRAHVANCNAKWGGTNQKLADTMNEMQERRKQLLEEAIKKLSEKE